jgi:hypothetical protein
LSSGVPLSRRMWQVMVEAAGVGLSWDIDSK